MSFSLSPLGGHGPGLFKRGMDLLLPSVPGSRVTCLGGGTTVSSLYKSQSTVVCGLEPYESSRPQVSPFTFCLGVTAILLNVLPHSKSWCPFSNLFDFSLFRWLLKVRLHPTTIPCFHFFFPSVTFVPWRKSFLWVSAATLIPLIPACLVLPCSTLFPLSRGGSTFLCGDRVFSGLFSWKVLWRVPCPCPIIFFRGVFGTVRQRGAGIPLSFFFSPGGGHVLFSKRVVNFSGVSLFFLPFFSHKLVDRWWDKG